MTYRPRCPHCDSLIRENKMLRRILQEHGLEIPAYEPEPAPVSDNQRPHHPTHPTLTTQEKIRLFRTLFKGREDLYPKRWESKKGTSGYTPACQNEWVMGLCGKKAKPRVKCGDCGNRSLLPMTDQVIYDHLSGKTTIGVYPLLTGDTCWFLAIDFDKGDWKADASAVMNSCSTLGVPAALEVSRSGNGAHLWIFFKEPVRAREARLLGAALISHACSETRQIKLSSYDRLFPNQDTMPKGGFGNLIALPLQKGPRARNGSVFVDDTFTPFHDQWAYLSGLNRMSPLAVEEMTFNATGSGHPVDVGLFDEESDTPWEKREPPLKITGPLPNALRITIANQLFIEKKGLSQSIQNRLIRLAAFQNPAFYKAQAMRFPVWDTPRVIGCAENFPKHIGMPRGCYESIAKLATQNGIQVDIEDKRESGVALDLSFKGELRDEQHHAVSAMLEHENGILWAPTAFGKTVTAASIIAERKVNTLVVVHRKELLRQWQERLQAFLDLSNCTVGALGGGRNTLKGQLDIAVIQSLAKQDALDEHLEGYGQVIVDECHHVSAVSFEKVLKHSKAKYVMGLTATPQRRDGHQPIIYMQCGPVRYKGKSSPSTQMKLCVLPRTLDTPAPNEELGIQEVFKHIINDNIRNRHLVDDISAAFSEGRKILILTERTGHLKTLQELLKDADLSHIALYGRMSRKKRKDAIRRLESLAADEPRILLATGKLIGEGFDHPPLDTLVLAMPISWKGTLQQYAGRLHRLEKGKKDIRIYDYVDHQIAPLKRMWNRRCKGYKAMGYEIGLSQEMLLFDM